MPSRGRRSVTKAPPASRRGRVIDGFLPMAGPTSLSRETSRCGLPHRPAQASEFFYPSRGRTCLRVRTDPVDPSAAAQQIVRVSLNGTHLGDLVLQWNPERIGQYQVTIPARSFAPGDQRLELRSDTAFKVWYVHVAAI